jgi:radical SAM superfamily enzyme YgiQ (UPF0313 family)
VADVSRLKFERTPRLKVALVGVSSPGYRSLALGYLRAYAEADPRLSDVGFTTLELDTAVDPWWIAYRALALEPDVVAFSVLCWNARIVYEAVRVISAARPEALIVLGGPEVGPIAETVLAENPAASVVVRGEGEAAFADVLAAHLRGSDFIRVAGTASRVGERIVSAPDRDIIADLDSIPSPYLTGVLEVVEGTAYIESYRGCPHACGYCYEGKGFQRIRRFSDERVAAEIAAIAQTPGVGTFSFIDPVFNLTPERLTALVEMLAPFAISGTRLHTIEVDIERIGAAEAAQLVRAGVASVETGPQSVGSAALAVCGRRFDPVAFSAGVRACRQAGIAVECDLIVGLPCDTVEDVVAGIDFAIGLDPGKVQLSTLHVLPGTDLWDRAVELGLRFDPQPPHEIIESAQMSYADLRRLEVLGNAAARLYAARL